MWSSEGALGGDSPDGVCPLIPPERGSLSVLSHQLGGGALSPAPSLWAAPCHLRLCGSIRTLCRSAAG